MTLRCRPGDLIVVEKAPAHRLDLVGAFATVLYLAPSCDFDLPDGALHAGMDDRNWVLRFPHAVKVYTTAFRARYTHYGCLPDWALRPIRPDAEPVDVEMREPAEASTC